MDRLDMHQSGGRGGEAGAAAQHGSDIQQSHGVHSGRGGGPCRLWPSGLRQATGEAAAGGLVLGSDLTPPSVVIGETVWSSRGWTYQESMLSRRCIIITESEVFYQCTELTHREGRLKTPAVGDFEFSPVASFPDLLRHCDGGYKGALFALYRNCVKEYTNRRLSYDRDGLIAFQRILSHLERQFGTYMVMGLPWGMMATSLVWDIRGEKLRRRREEKPVGMGVAITSPLLPSWTWAAWEGQVGWGVKVNT